MNKHRLGIQNFIPLGKNRVDFKIVVKGIFSLVKNGFSQGDIKLKSIYYLNYCTGCFQS